MSQSVLVLVTKWSGLSPCRRPCCSCCRRHFPPPSFSKPLNSDQAPLFCRQRQRRQRAWFTAQWRRQQKPQSSTQRQIRSTARFVQPVHTHTLSLSLSHARTHAYLQQKQQIFNPQNNFALFCGQKKLLRLPTMRKFSTAVRMDEPAWLVSIQTDQFQRRQPTCSLSCLQAARTVGGAGLGARRAATGVGAVPGRGAGVLRGRPGEAARPAVARGVRPGVDQAVPPAAAAGPAARDPLAQRPVLGKRFLFRLDLFSWTRLRFQMFIFGGTWLKTGMPLRGLVFLFIVVVFLIFQKTTLGRILAVNISLCLFTAIFCAVWKRKLNVLLKETRTGCMEQGSGISCFDFAWDPSQAQIAVILLYIYREGSPAGCGRSGSPASQKCVQQKCRFLCEIYEKKSSRTRQTTETVNCKATSTQDARANSNTNPLMLLACSVNTPIHAHRFHLLCIALRVLCG